MFSFKLLTVILSRLLDWLNHTVGHNQKSQSQMLQIWTLAQGGPGPNFALLIFFFNPMSAFLLKLFSAIQVVSEYIEPDCQEGNINHQDPYV